MVFGGKRRALLDEHSAAVRSRRRGIIGVIVIAAVLAATGLAYLNPTGRDSYTAHMPNSAGVRPGDEVRVAGVRVGKVTSVRLDRTLVEMKFAVQRSVAVGSASTLDVKLLTPLGGHYLALDPKGDLPLGHQVIPAERVTTPFEVNDIIQAATPVIEEVNGQVIHDTFTEVANAANKYPNAVRDIIESTNALTATLSKSTADFHRGLDFVNNSLRAAVAGRKQILTLVEQFDLLGKLYTSKAVDIIEFFSTVKELSRIFDRVVTFYGREVAPIVNALDDIFDTLFAHPDGLGKAADDLGQILRIVVPMLSGNGVIVDKGGGLVPGQDLCLPNIMKHC